MTRSHRIDRFTRIATILIVSALAGACSEKEHVTGEHFNPPYPILSSPQNVLTAMALAYERRDSVETATLYDQNYRGASLDATSPNPIQLILTRTDEVRHVSALARRSSITSVNLSLNPSLIRYSDASDPPGWATIGDPISTLAINDAPSSYMLNLASETMTFTFVPQTPDSTSPTDTTWKIIRWSELKN